MQTLKLILKNVTEKERVTLAVAFALFLFALGVHFAKTVEERGAYAPVRGGSYTEGIVGQPVMVNPVFSTNQADQDISSLVYADIASLISDWKLSDDGREYTIKLKEGVLWSDGQPLTSDDVLFTIQTIQNPDARSPLAKDWQGIVTERVSQLQVKFTLPTPYVFFTKNLKTTRLIPQHIFAAIPIANMALSEYNLEPVGSGPYAFDGFSKRKDGFITDYRLVANKHYANEKPYIQNFTFNFYATSEELVNDLRLRRIDGFGSSLPLGSETRAIPRIAVDTAPMPRYYAIFINQVNNPTLKDANLRAALAMAIDKQAIAKDLFKGNATAMESPLMRNLIGFEPQSALGSTVTPEWSTTDATPIYDPAKAASIIAGLKTKNITLNLVVPKVPFLEQVAEKIKENWIAAGIADVTITDESTDTLLNDYVKTRNYDLLLFGNVYENPADLFPFWHSSQRFFPGLNLSLYQNAEADTLMESVRQKDDPKSQTANLERLEELLQRDDPAIYLFSMPYFYAHSSLLKGFDPKLVTSPEDRFRNVAEWNLSSVRIIK